MHIPTNPRLSSAQRRELQRLVGNLRRLQKIEIEAAIGQAEISRQIEVILDQAPQRATAP